MQAEIAEIHRLIMRARTARARTAIQKLAEGKIPRAHAAAIASLAWRAEMPGVGIRILHPFVRPRAKRPATASDEERAEYAQCLVTMGAPDEGGAILDRLDERVLPRVLYYRAIALISQWNFRDAIPVLWRYLKGPQIDPYSQLLGKVQLAVALVHVRDHRKSTPLLRELLYTTSLHGYELMLGRVLELSAEDFVQRKKWDEAESFLEQASRRLQDSHGIDEFFVREYRAIVRFHREREGLRELRAEATERGFWETVRDCDHAEAIETGDAKLLQKLYFGTPYPHYRERLAREMKVPDHYVWNPHGGGKPKRVIDFDELLPRGGLLHRLALTLAGDFYHPWRLAALHARVYPARHFNPASSPPLIHDATTRLRNVFRKEKIPLRVVEKNGFYRLVADAAVGIRLAAAPDTTERSARRLVELRKTLAARAFSVGEAAKVLELPLRSAQRLLQEANREGAIERTGKARATKYSFRSRS